MLQLPEPRRKPYRIHLVCMGNICRSPTAEVVLADVLAACGLEAEVSSSGTGGWHVGEGMDPRAREALAARGYDGSGHRARQITGPGDFDLVLAMDRDNLGRLRRIGVPDGRLALFRTFDTEAPEGAEVPDPYYEGGFDRVLDMVEAAARGLADRLEKVL